MMANNMHNIEYAHQTTGKIITFICLIKISSLGMKDAISSGKEQCVLKPPLAFPFKGDGFLGESSAQNKLPELRYCYFYDTNSCAKLSLTSVETVVKSINFIDLFLALINSP